MTKTITQALPDEAATIKLGQALAQCDLAGAYIALQGPLGAGKTTLVRALLQALGVQGPVKSPTYALLESYDEVKPKVHHLDLYRMCSPEALHDVGIEACFSESALILIEWPENGQGVLPDPTLSCTLSWQDQGRVATFSAQSASGLLLLEALQSKWA